jgi:GT2 family glycosyltransferase
VSHAASAAPELSGAHAHPPPAVTLLCAVHRLLGRRRRGRALLEALRLRRLARYWLRAAVVAPQRRRPDDVTVLIGVRDRTDHRLGLALRSIREQEYPAALLHALVVDYGSEPAAAGRTAEVCRDYQATYVRVETAGVWSRSRCLNVGVRRAATKFLLTSDVDILFAPAYVAEAVRALRESPLSVVCSRMLDLPEDTADELRRTGECGAPLRLHEWKRASTPRYGWRSHPSIAMTYTAFHQAIRGYDEFYELWGAEDVDLLRRLTKLGLERRALTSEAAFYLHQWHPKYENLPVEGRERAVRRNEERWRRLQTIVRNDASWGAGR